VNAPQVLSNQDGVRSCGVESNSPAGSFVCCLPAYHLGSNRHLWLSSGDDEIVVFYTGSSGGSVAVPYSPSAARNALEAEVVRLHFVEYDLACARQAGLVYKRMADTARVALDPEKGAP